MNNKISCLYFLEFVAVRGGLTRCARPAGSVAGSAVQRAAPVVEPRGVLIPLSLRDINEKSLNVSSGFSLK